MGAFSWHPAEDRCEADRRVLDIFGLSSTEELTLAAVLDTMIHPEDRDRYAQGVTQSLRFDGDRKLEEEIRIRRRDGQERWISVTAQVHFADGREADLMIGLIGDITEWKRTELALRESEERQAFLLTLSDALRPLADAIEIQETAAASSVSTSRPIVWDTRKIAAMARPWPLHGSSPIMSLPSRVRTGIATMAKCS
jgi:PAS domain S-box-containing protein